MKYRQEQRTFDEAAFDEEALRLTLAFYSIMEPEKRAIILALAERYAGRPEPFDAEARIHDQ